MKYEELSHKILEGMAFFDTTERGYTASELGEIGIGRNKALVPNTDFIVKRSTQGMAMAVGKTLKKMAENGLIQRKSCFFSDTSLYWYKTSKGEKLVPFKLKK